MGVRENNGIDRLWIEREVAVVQLFLGFRALEKATVDKDTAGTGLDFEAGARDAASGAVKP
jgi:hypothetical protein